jgi:hypothetical protein
MRYGGKKEMRARAGIYAAQRASHDERKRRRCKETPRNGNGYLNLFFRQQCEAPKTANAGRHGMASVGVTQWEGIS